MLISFFFCVKSDRLTLKPVHVYEALVEKGNMKTVNEIRDPCML